MATGVDLGPERADRGRLVQGVDQVAGVVHGAPATGTRLHTSDAEPVGVVLGCLDVGLRAS